MGVVILSTVVFILSTLPELTDDIDMISASNTTDSKGGDGDQPVERWEDVSRHLQRLVRSHQHLQSQLSLYVSICSHFCAGYHRSPGLGSPDDGFLYSG